MRDSRKSVTLSQLRGSRLWRRSTLPSPRTSLKSTLWTAQTTSSCITTPWGQCLLMRVKCQHGAIAEPLRGMLAWRKWRSKLPPCARHSGSIHPSDTEREYHRCDFDQWQSRPGSKPESNIHYTTVVGALPMNTPILLFWTALNYSRMYYTTFVGVLPKKCYWISGSTPKLTQMVNWEFFISLTIKGCVRVSVCV